MSTDENETVPPILASYGDSIFDESYSSPEASLPELTPIYRRRVLTLTNLSLIQRETLHLSGIEWTRQIVDLGVSGLESVFKNRVEAQTIYDEASKGEIPPVQITTGVQLLDEKKGCIPTGCASIDKLFTPSYLQHKVKQYDFSQLSLYTTGLPVKSLIEVSGVPGTGKTTFCFQVAFQLAVTLKKETIFLDSEGTASSFSRRFKKILSDRGLNVATCLSHVQYQRIFTLEELVVILESIDTEYIASRPQTRLLVIDSLARLYSRPILPKNEKAQFSSKINSLLQSISQNLTILVVNHLEQTGQELSAKPDCPLQPGLGENWSASSNHNLLFAYGAGAKRFVSLLKSSCAPPYSTQIRLTNNGVEDWDHSNNVLASPQNSLTHLAVNPPEFQKSAFSAYHDSQQPVPKKARYESYPQPSTNSNEPVSNKIPESHPYIVESSQESNYDSTKLKSPRSENATSIGSVGDLSPLTSLNDSPTNKVYSSNNSSSAASHLSPPASKTTTLPALPHNIDNEHFNENSPIVLKAPSRESSGLDGLVTTFDTTGLQAPSDDITFINPNDNLESDDPLGPTISQHLAWNSNEPSFFPALDFLTQDSLTSSQLTGSVKNTTQSDRESTPPN